MEALGKLFVDASRYHGAKVHNAVSKLGVGRGMPPVLGYICENNGCMQSQISRLSHVSPATTTVMLQSMEKNGFIERKSDPADQRCMRIYITEAGRDVARLGKETVEQVDAQFFGVLDKDEKESFRKILLKLIGQYETEEFQ